MAKFNVLHINIWAQIFQHTHNKIYIIFLKNKKYHLIILKYILFNSFLIFIFSQIWECTLILCPPKTSSYNTQHIIFVYLTHSPFLLYPF